MVKNSIDMKAAGKNTNCLYGMRCPNCGYEDRFKIVASGWVYVTDEGTDDTDAEYEWEGNSPCICARCDHVADVVNFTIEEGK